MDEILNLSGAQAITKLFELANGKICMLCAYTGSREVHCRPMFTAAVDKEGNLWFLSRDDSHQNQELKKHSKVTLTYADNDKHAYLVVNGTATTGNDRATIEELWSPIAEPWFPDGIDDPAIELIKVEPATGHYWDTKHGKVLALLHMVSSAVTGAQDDDGRQGDLKL